MLEFLKVHVNLFKLRTMLQEIERCKSSCELHEKALFIKRLRNIFDQHLPDFNEIIDFYAREYQFGKDPFLVVETYESANDIFLKIKQILQYAVHLDTYDGYKLMNIALAYMYTPVVKVKSRRR